MSDAPNDESPVQEAESRPDSPEMDQDRQSPDSTIQEGIVNVQSTSGDRLMRRTNQNRNIGENIGHQSLITGNLSQNEILTNEEEQRPHYGPMYNTDEINVMRENKPKLYAALTRNSGNDKDLTNQANQSSSFRQIAQTSASRFSCSPRLPGDAFGLAQIVADFFKANLASNDNLTNQGQQISTSELWAQPSTSTARSASSPSKPGDKAKENPLLANLLLPNFKATENINQREESSRITSQSSYYTERTFRPPQPLNFTTQGEQSSASRQSASSSPQPGETIRSMIEALSSFYTERTSRSAQHRQVVKQEEQSFRIMEHSTSERRESTSVQPEVRKQSPPFTNMPLVNPAANANTNQTGEQKSVPRSLEQSITPFFHSPQPPRLTLKREESFGQIAQRSSSATESLPSSSQSRQTLRENPLLTDMLRVKQSDQNLIDGRQESSASIHWPRPSTSTARFASGFSQTCDKIEQNPQKGEQSSEIKPTAQFGTSTSKFVSHLKPPSHIVKLGGKSFKQKAQDSTSAAGSATNLPRRRESLNNNPLLTNMLADNSASSESISKKRRQSGANRSIAHSRSSSERLASRPVQTHNVLKQVEHTSASSIRTRTSIYTRGTESCPAQSRQVFKQEDQISASRQIQQPNTSTAKTTPKSPKPGDIVMNNPLLTNMFMDDSASNKNLNKRDQRCVSRSVAHSRAYTAPPTFGPPQPRQIVKRGQQSSTFEHWAQPSTSTGKSSTSPSKPVDKGNPLFTNILAPNFETNQNLMDQSKQSSVLKSQSSFYTEGTSRIPQPLNLSKRGEQSSVSRQSAQQRACDTESASNSPEPLNLTTRGEQSSASIESAASSPQPGESIKKNSPLKNIVRVNPGNDNLMNEDNFPESGIKTQTRDHKGSPPFYLAQHQAVKRESPTSRQTAQSRLPTTARSASRSPRHGEVFNENVLLQNMFTDNSASNYLVNKEQSSTSGQPVEQRIQSERRASGPTQPCQIFEQNQTLTNMFRQATINENLTNTEQSSSSFRQTVQESPSRRKRESGAPDTEPSCSPTKKMKSPNKKNSK